MDKAVLLTVLVVDDRAINREFLVMLLDYAGYRVLEAGDGVEALAIVQREQIALVISDILMPVMDGLELVHRLHREPATAHIPVIFYTATYRAHEVRMLAQTCGVATVLEKPAEPKAILAAVSSVLGINAAAMEPGRSSHQQPAPHLLELAALQSRLQHASPALNESSPDDGSMYAAGNMQALSLRTAALLELSMTLSLESDPQEVIELFHTAVQDVMNAKCTAVGLNANGQPQRFAQRGMSDTDVAAIFDALDADTGMLRDPLFHAKLLRTEDIRNHPAAVQLPAHLLQKNALLVPITLRSRPYGWLYVADKLGTETFNEEDEQFVAVLVAQLVPFYENLVLFDEVQRHVGELELEVIERRRVTDALQESEVRFRQLAEHIHQVFFLISQDNTQMLYVSPAYEAIWGRSCASLYAAPLSWMNHIHPDDQERARKDYAKRGALGRFDLEYRIVQPDATVRSIRMRGFPIPPAANQIGRVPRIAGIAEDITEKTVQATRIARLNRLYAILSAINSAIVRIRDRNELFQAACRIAVNHGTFSMAWIGVIDPDTLEGEVVACFGGQPGDVQNIKLTAHAGTTDSERPACVAVRERRAVICNNVQTDPALASFKTNLLAHGHHSVAAWPMISGHRLIAVIELFAPERDFFDDEQIKLLDELAGDLSFGLQFIDREEKLSYLAYYDALTGLPNATLFHDRLTQFLHGAKHERNITAVIVINLQHFAHLNDAMGRHAGDLVLNEVGRRLGAVLREPYSLARIGGDTFAVALAGLHHGTDVVPILEQRIFEPFEQLFAMDRHEIRISVQAGLALYPEDGETAEILFRHAEVALKKAKSSDERYLYYAPQMNAAIAARLALENEMRLALEAQQFVMHYQPRVDLVSGRIVSAEALIRWEHPQRGRVSPAEFIPLAEETGLIVPIGAWAINSVCAQQAGWLKQNLAIVPVAVNLSAVQFKRGQVLQTIRDAIALHGLESHYIEFELTESVVMNDPDEAARSLEVLKSMGLKLSLDDFGTGYSSLAYLKRFPFDFVKIDRAFVSDITRSPEDAAIANAVIAMAHNLNMRVVAEGVETEAQLHYLRKHQCDELQGYYFSPPVQAVAFEAMLREDKRLILEREPVMHVNTLLIVDDEPNNLSALKRLLRQDEYILLTASSGAEALELLASNTVQVIMSDQRMPGMLGTEFLAIAKSLYPDTVRIILSGYADLDVVIESVNRGEVFKFLTKPWDDHLLREHIRDAFRRHRPAP